MTPPNTVDAERLLDAIEQMIRAVDAGYNVMQRRHELKLARDEYLAARAEPQDKAEMPDTLAEFVASQRPMDPEIQRITAENFESLLDGPQDKAERVCTCPLDDIPGPMYVADPMRHAATCAVRTPPTEGKADRVEDVIDRALADALSPTGGAGMFRVSYVTPPTGEDTAAAHSWPSAMRWRTPLGDWSRWHDYSPDKQGDMVRAGCAIELAYPLTQRQAGGPDWRGLALRAWQALDVAEPFAQITADLSAALSAAGEEGKP